MSRESHRWGESHAADVAWSLFAGLLEAEERLVIIIQGILDESESESGTFVVGGYLATAPAVAKIAKDWDPLRRKFGVLDKDGSYQFKFNEISRESRRENLAPFYRVIEANIIGGLAVAFNKLDLLRAHVSLSLPISDLKMTTYQFAVRELLGVFHTHRELFANALPSVLGAKVDFIFDNHSDKRGVDAGWDNFVASEAPQFRSNFGAGPIFRDDKDFLPLQAADFLAGYLRECVDKGQRPNFHEWKQHREFNMVWLNATEDDFRKMLSDPAVRRLAPLSKHGKSAIEI